MVMGPAAGAPADLHTDAFPARLLPMTGTRALLWGSGAAVAGLSAVLLVIGAPMAEHGHSILAFEFSGGAGDAERILRDWGDEGRDAAELSLLLDFAFLLAYSTFLFVANAARWARGAAVLAGACDAVENVALLLVLDDRTGGWPVVAQTFATIKFAAVAVAVGGVLARVARWVRGRRVAVAR
jgi:hypothetical protein